MTDFIDDAQRHIEAEREAAIARQLATVPRVATPITNRACNGCGDWIGMDRLNAVPHAVLCIECATVLEHRQKQGRP